jgi:molybdopterin molybdotransferase
MSNLRNVDEAIQAILSTIQRCPPQTVSLEAAAGRILATDIPSDIDLPPFTNSAMDGYALRGAETIQASPDNPVELEVVMDIPAGRTPPKALAAGQAARIMTGAPLPDGADAVIRVEDTDDDFSALAESSLPERVRIFAEAPPGNSVRAKGENIASGDTILEAGTRLTPAAIGMLATVGRARVPVVSQPRVVILSSGDELVDIGTPLQPGQIRDANSYALAALVTANGGDPLRLPLAGDDPQQLRDLFQNALALQPDLIISSAGVSVGAADYVREILDEMGDIDFWKINLRPGKPLAFGHLGEPPAAVPFFGLPGNPVSTIVTFNVLVRPALLKQAGRSDTTPYSRAIVGETMHSDGRRTYARVTLQEEDGQTVAYSTGSQSSGALMSMVTADALLIIPEGTKKVEPGTELRVQLLR